MGPNSFLWLLFCGQNAFSRVQCNPASEQLSLSATMCSWGRKPGLQGTLAPEENSHDARCHQRNRRYSVLVSGNELLFPTLYVKAEKVQLLKFKCSFSVEDTVREYVNPTLQCWD